MNFWSFLIVVQLEILTLKQIVIVLYLLELKTLGRLALVVVLLLLVLYTSLPGAVQLLGCLEKQQKPLIAKL